MSSPTMCHVGGWRSKNAAQSGPERAVMLRRGFVVRNASLSWWWIPKVEIKSDL